MDSRSSPLSIVSMRSASANRTMRRAVVKEGVYPGSGVVLVCAIPSLGCTPVAGGLFVASRADLRFNYRARPLPHRGRANFSVFAYLRPVAPVVAGRLSFALLNYPRALAKLDQFVGVLFE
jgi:hypothetical protein